MKEHKDTMCRLTTAFASGNQIVIWASLYYLAPSRKLRWACLQEQSYLASHKRHQKSPFSQHQILTLFALWSAYDYGEIPQLHKLGLIWALVIKPNLVHLIKWWFVCRCALTGLHICLSLIRHFYPQSELLIADNWLRIKFKGTSQRSFWCQNYKTPIQALYNDVLYIHTGFAAIMSSAFF